MHQSKCGIYAIYDKVADQIIGQLQMIRADAAAIRLFQDVAADPQTLVSKHTQDFDLLLLGFIDAQNHIQQHHEIILTGAALATMRDEVHNDTAP